MKWEPGCESKEGVPCKVNRKHELVTENDNFTTWMLGSTHNTSQNLQRYCIVLHVRNFSSVHLDREAWHTIMALMTEGECMIAKR